MFLAMVFMFGWVCHSLLNSMRCMGIKDGRSHNICFSHAEEDTNADAPEPVPRQSQHQGGNGNVTTSEELELEMNATATATATSAQEEGSHSLLLLDHSSDDTKLEHKTVQDDICKREFEWSMIDYWTEIGKEHPSPQINYEQLPESRVLTALRSDNKLRIGMKVTVLNKKLQLTVVDTRKMKDVFSTNLWHRMAPQYDAWVGLQTAERRYNVTSDRTVFLIDSRRNETDLPTGWSDIGEVTCNSTILDDADAVIVPPTDGLIWDLAWDHNLQCHNSDMFKAFVHQFVAKQSTGDPLGCFISRQGRPIRIVTNFDEVMEMMHEVFPRVRINHFTEEHTIDEIVDLLYECRVLFGVHGAGHMNALFTRPGVGVVEIVGTTGVAYFKNINMLLGQHYEAIAGDKTQGMSGQFHVNLTEAKPALERARDHAALWIKEKGQW